MKLYKLDKLIQSVCPIDGINSDGAIFYRSEATSQQRAEAAALMAQYLPSLTLDGPPDAVTMRQARLALLQIGKLGDVATAIAALPSPQKEAASIEWEYSNEVQRGNAFVATLGFALGLTEQQLDDLFTLAATL